MSETTEVIDELLETIQLDITYRTPALDLLEKAGSRYLRDLKVNFTSTLESEYLSAKEIGLIGVSISVNNNNKPLTDFYTAFASKNEATEAEIAEAVSCASLLASNNVFYRFRHFTQKEKYTQIPARIRMQIMMKPINGKEFFELMSLAVSAVNGCEMCVNSHEDSLMKLGAKEERVFDAVRIASLITATGKIIY
ncbi:Alkylhydroperoxidase protein D [Arcticibacter svalbardensis MN12-7]|uniref:Alkyl hydroperoxide reductase AhpD n=1 Tax=Arcticibacter svalbardensis MN12-7 TaxID=1150600 RepID=R9GQQ7_9SPHI|nr:carboxymuconolactone decarboxylase family protein [Arcticibacter svalbardensis]EOR94048.1 Alkylhydroperoxidase protein D [Arcticibacter svalbardensis MN12-7]